MKTAPLIAACGVLCAGFAQAQTDRFIVVNGLRLHYLDWGSADKPPFIMLHGISRVAHQFDHIAPYFTANYHVIAIDMRGHGDSDWSPEGAPTWWRITSKTSKPSSILSTCADSRCWEIQRAVEWSKFTPGCIRIGWRA
jgi:pimeloyl-ACP methyl ester carboxylesterase